MKASDILSLQDLRTKKVKVKQWKCELTIRELGLNEAVQFSAMVKDGDEGLTMTGEQIAQIVAWGVIDPESGERMFSDDDVPNLAKKSLNPLMTLYQEIIGLSGAASVKN